MYLPLLFWLGLLLPGYVLVRLFARDVLRSGLMGTIATSYLAVFALLSPVSIIGYALGAPLALLSAACVVVFVAALVYITYRGWWAELGRLLVLALSVELAIVVVDLFLSAWAGAHTGGDAILHMTRIRFLVDNGLLNQDPYVEFAAPFPVYHTNLYHTLQAACVQLTGTDAYAVWSNTLAWAKLVGFAGCYMLGWTIFERRWAGWILALAIMTPQMSTTYHLYPNQLGIHWLVPLMLSFAIRAAGAGTEWSAAPRLAAGALVLGQVHALYAFFAGLTIGPVLAGLLLFRLLRRGGQRLALVACLAALLAGAPFPLLARAASSYAPTEQVTKAEQPPTETRDSQRRAGFRSDRYWYFDNGWVMVKASPGWGRMGALAGGLVAGLLTRRRRAILATAALGLVVAIVFFIPPICTLFVDLLGEMWILLRLNKILWVFVWNALTLGTLAYVVDLGLDRLVRPSSPGAVGDDPPRLRVMREQSHA